MRIASNIVHIEGNPLQDHWLKILAVHKKHFVQPFIRRHLAEELRSLTPELQNQLAQTSHVLKKLRDQYGLAYHFLNIKRSGGLELDSLIDVMDVLSKRLRSELYEDASSSLYSDQWTGKTRGNRKQVEISGFVVALADILKKANGVPWGNVQTAIKLLAESDHRLKQAATLYISNGESGRQALRSLYNRTASTQAASHD